MMRLLLSAVLIAAAAATNDKGLAFLAANKEKEGVVELPSGLQYKIIESGPSPGKSPLASTPCECHYAGTLIDGTEFDSSRARESPFTFKLGEGKVIKGWEIAIAAMQKGEKAVITLQPEYAYGANGAPPKISPNAVLEFEIELLDFHPIGFTFGGAVYDRAFDPYSEASVD